MNPACSRVGSVALSAVLRQSFKKDKRQSHKNSEGIAFLVMELDAALYNDIRAKKYNIKYLISFNGNQTPNLSRSQPSSAYFTSFINNNFLLYTNVDCNIIIPKEH